MIENSQDGIIKGWRFTNSQKQSIAKAILPNKNRLLTLQGPAPFAAASFRKQLTSGGFTLLNQTQFKGAYLEMYRKDRIAVTISFSDGTEDGKLLAEYMISIVDA